MVFLRERDARAPDLRRIEIQCFLGHLRFPKGVGVEEKWAVSLHRLAWIDRDFTAIPERISLGPPLLAFLSAGDRRAYNDLQSRSWLLAD